MTTAQLRKQVKKAVDTVPAERLAALAEFVAFLSRPPLRERLARARREFASGKGVNWRTVRSDV